MGCLVDVVQCGWDWKDNSACLFVHIGNCFFLPSSMLLHLVCVVGAFDCGKNV